MTAPIRLVPLVCINCRQPILAQPDEVAWVCETCQKGSILGDDGLLKSLDIFFSPQVQPGTKGKPYWVTLGQVQISDRQTFKGNEGGEASAFWQSPRLFFIPAYALSLEQQVAAGMALLRNPVNLPAPGGPVPFVPVVMPPADVRPLAEFIVLAIEADRRDALKTVSFNLSLQPAQLWVLPS